MSLLLLTNHRNSTQIQWIFLTINPMSHPRTQTRTTTITIFGTAYVSLLVFSPPITAKCWGLDGYLPGRNCLNPHHIPISVFVSCETWILYPTTGQNPYARLVRNYDIYFPWAMDQDSLISSVAIVSHPSSVHVWCNERHNRQHDVRTYGIRRQNPQPLPSGVWSAKIHMNCSTRSIFCLMNELNI